MDRDTKAAVEDIFGSDRSFYEQADLLMRLLTAENVADVMSSVPLPFRSEFAQFAREAYLPPRSSRIVFGTPLPAQSIDAVRGWLTRVASASATRAIPDSCASLLRFEPRDTTGDTTRRVNFPVTYSFGEH